MSCLNVKYAIAAAPLFLAFGCGLHSASVNDPLPAAQIAQALQQSFQWAGASANAVVSKIIEEMHQNDVAAAFTDIKELSAQPNLTKDQRIAAIRAANTIGQELQEAVQKGDEQAAATLRSYKANH